MQQNATGEKPFAWSAKSAQAAVRVAEDVLSDESIADEANVNRSTLHRWKQHPDFRARVNEHFEDMQDRARRRGLARLDVRQARYQRRAEALDLIVAERAAAADEDPDLVDVPGWRSGYLVRQFKSIGTGPNARQVEEYHFDAALAREQGSLEKQAAQDAGQFAEKADIMIGGGLRREYVIVTDGTA